MEIKTIGSLHLMERGRIEFEKTDLFRVKMEEIKYQVSEIYDKKIANESNGMKRVLLKFKKWIEIKKRIREFSSLRNLHLTGKEN
jgi:hypothetical protein